MRAWLAALGLIGCLGVRAEEAPLLEIVVSASREATQLSETPSSISTVNRKAIETTKPVSLYQLLNQATGVHMADLGNEQHTMSIRMPISYSAFYQYLEDNIPIRPIGLFNHNALLETNLTGAGSVEVLRGPASSLYGSNAVGGTVNLLSRAPARAREANVGLRGSPDGYYRLDAGYSESFGEVGTRLSAYEARNDSSWRQHNDFQKDGVSARLDVALGEASYWKQLLTYNLLDSDMPGSLTKDQFYASPSFSYHTFTYRRDESLRYSSTLETDWTNHTQTAVTLFLRDGEVKQNPSYSINNAAGTADRNGRITTSDYRSYGVDARWRQHLEWAEGRLIAGGIYDHSPTAYREEVIRVQRAGNLQFVGYTPGGWINVNAGQNCNVLSSSCQVINTRRDFDVTIDNPSLYTQYEFSPWTDWRLVAGARYDLIRYGYRNKIFNPSQAGFGPASEARDFEHVSPKLGAIYHVSPTVVVYSNVSEGFVPPEITSLYGALAVPSLKEAVYRNVDLGLRLSLNEGAGQLEAAVYRLNGKDEVLSFTPCPVGTSCPQGSMPVNAGRTRHQGLELGLKQALTPTWDLRLTGTLAEHEYVDYVPQPGVDFSGKDMALAPTFVGNGELAWKPAVAWRLGLEAQHVSRYWTDENNSKEYPGYTIWNLRGQYQHNGWESFAQLLNVADKRYATVAQHSFGSQSFTPGDPRTLMVGVNYHWGGAR